MILLNKQNAIQNRFTFSFYICCFYNRIRLCLPECVPLHFFFYTQLKSLNYETKTKLPSTFRVERPEKCTATGCSPPMANNQTRTTQTLIPG